MDVEKLDKSKGDYSPLNNLSSSGEEVQQFSLPTVMNGSKQKRRRKRKEFDLLRTQPSTHRLTRSSCGMGVICTVFGFIILLSTVCAMSVLLYQLYLQVSELQHQNSKLNVLVSEFSSKERTLLSDLDVKIEKERTNIFDQIHMMNETLVQAKIDLQALQDEHDKVKEPNDKFHDTLEKLELLKQESDSLKQLANSSQGRIQDLESALKSITPKSAFLDADHAITILQNQVLHLNDTFSSKFHTVNELLNVIYMNYTAAATQEKQVFQQIDAANAVFRQSIQNVNSTAEAALAEARRHTQENRPISQISGNAEITSSPPLQMDELIHRVDLLESSLRTLHASLDDKTALLVEQNVVNLTVSKGLEDVVSRVIDIKMAAFKDDMDKISYHSSSVDAKLVSFESRINALHRQIFETLQNHGDNLKALQRSPGEKLNVATENKNATFPVEGAYDTSP